MIRTIPVHSCLFTMPAGSTNKAGYLLGKVHVGWCRKSKVIRWFLMSAGMWALLCAKTWHSEFLQPELRAVVGGYSFSTKKDRYWPVPVSPCSKRPSDMGRWQQEKWLVYVSICIHILYSTVYGKRSEIYIYIVTYTYAWKYTYNYIYIYIHIDIYIYTHIYIYRCRKTSTWWIVGSLKKI